MTEEVTIESGESGKLNIVMDISQFDTFRLCEQKYQYRYLMNKHPAEKAKALERGTLVHLAAETYYELLKSQTPFEDAKIAALSAVRTAGVTSELDVDDILRVNEVMDEYFEFWRVADQGFEIVEVEKPFIYQFHETDVWRLFLTGKIDLIISDNRYTNLPVDHKSYDRSYPTGRMSNQFKNYCYALNSNYLLVNKIGFQETVKPDKKYVRVPLSYDHQYFELWKKSMIRSVEHYVDCIVSDEWPMNETSCDKFNRRCEYYDVCDSSNQESKDFKLASLFINGEPWDVTKNLKKTSQSIMDLTVRKDNE